MELYQKISDYLPYDIWKHYFYARISRINSFFKYGLYLWSNYVSVLVLCCYLQIYILFLIIAIIFLKKLQNNHGTRLFHLRLLVRLLAREFVTLGA